MKRKRRTYGFGLIEALVVIGVIALLGFLYLWLGEAKKRAIRLACVNSLKESQYAFSVWASGNNGKFPMAIPDKEGGALESSHNGNVFRCFQTMSNELSTPIVTCCPADTERYSHATNFTNFKNENVSFFVGADADRSNPKGWLCGDRNITNGLASEHGVLTLQTGQSAGWTEKLHQGCGNVALAAGSVQMLSNPETRKIIKESANWTNRVALPE